MAAGSVSAPKKSAEGVAAIRFLGSFERNAAVCNPDRLAGGFLSPALRLAIGSPALRPAVRGLIMRRFPGAIEYQVARTKHFDHVLLQALDEGVKQVVLLGAGYDTRACRFADSLNGARLLEVDHPSTLARKQSLMRSALGAPLVDVKYVAVDFEQDDLVRSLLDSGFQDDLQTLFMWEGVTMFITADAVQRILSFVAHGSAPGSRILFDYVCARALEEPDAFYGGKQAARHFTRSGEPWRFGIDPDTAEAFIDQRGLRLVSHFRPSDMEECYLRRSSGALLGHVPDFHGMICAARAQR